MGRGWLAIARHVRPEAAGCGRRRGEGAISRTDEAAFRRPDNSYDARAREGTRRSLGLVEGALASSMDPNRDGATDDSSSPTASCP
jgi:hypothetical protein